MSGILLAGVSIPVPAAAAGPSVTPIGQSQNIPTDGAGVIVEDQPTAILNPDGSAVPYAGAVMLENKATGTRIRVDTDSSGNPLVPAWSGQEIDEPSANSNPTIVVSSRSVTRDANVVAFCANYDTPKRFTLYLKNLATGVLTKRAEACGVGGPDPGGEYVRVSAPETSGDGRVIHLRGAVYADGIDDPDTYFYPDTLVFPRSAKAPRVLNGNGSMTRDGKTLFMRIGVREYGTRDRTGGKVGVYNISTKRTRALPGKHSIYGTPALYFDAFTQATYRGRFVAFGDRPLILDRQTGAASNIADVVAQNSGYTPEKRTGSTYQTQISNDGKTAYTLVEDGWIENEVGLPKSQYVAVTGWEPTAKVVATPISGNSRLHVDVDPNKGSGYWTFRVQYKDSSDQWRNLRATYKTTGRSETRTLNLGKGSYRVVVKGKYGYLGSTSAEVQLSS